MALPNTLHIIKYLEEIGQKVSELTARHKKISKSEPLIAFRGEPQDYGPTKLTPSLFRDSDYVTKEEHLFELFCDYNIASQGASNIEKAIEAQHYASISRMLDISFDVLVSLYFVCKKDSDHDGYLYVFAFPEHYSPHSKYIEEFYTNILERKYTAYSRNFKVFTHSFTNDRIKAQRGGFIFFPGKEFYPISECYYERVCIPKNEKDLLLKEMATFFALTQAALFPEKGVIAEVATAKFKNDNYLPQTVSLENEVNTFFIRIAYELKSTWEKGTVRNRKAIMRQIRKEKSDLLDYIYKQAPKSDIQKLKEKVTNNFRILEIRYKEV